MESRLYEEYGEASGVIVSPSKVIPSTDEIQPPHKQAAAYYRAAEKLGGNFVVTMEHPTRKDPKPVTLKVSGLGQGVALERPAPAGTAAVVARPPRAG